MVRAMLRGVLLAILVCANCDFNCFAAESQGLLVDYRLERQLASDDFADAKSSAFAVDAKKADKTSHAVFESDSEVVCDRSPELIFDVDPIRTYLGARAIAIGYESIQTNYFFIQTSAAVNSDKTTASYYGIYTMLKDCSDSAIQRTCKLTASARLFVAPIEGNRIKASMARHFDDSVTAALIGLAKKAVRSATFWCSVKSKVDEIIRPLKY